MQTQRGKPKYYIFDSEYLCIIKHMYKILQDTKCTQCSFKETRLNYITYRNSERKYMDALNNTMQLSNWALLTYIN